jgi:hypothetical protein
MSTPTFVLAARTGELACGQSNFCPQCGRQAALRHADLRRKSRIRQARQLYGAGMSVVGIAHRLKAIPRQRLVVG